MVNLDVTRLNIEYRVMDGWGNLSNIANRVVYIYESSHKCKRLGLQYLTSFPNRP